jgi:hypothetical protein
MSLRLIPKRTAEADQAVVEALEQLLERARQGRIQSLIVLGIEHGPRITHRVRHRATCISMIGALHCLAYELQAEYNAGANCEDPDIA